MLGRTAALLGLILPIALAWSPGSGRAAGPQESVGDVHALILKVEQLPRFSQAAVEHLFGVKLTGDPKFPGPSDPRAKIVDGPFSEVRFIELRPQGAAASWHISVTIRRAAAIPIEAIDRQFIGRKLHGATDGPYESTGTYTLDRRGVLLHLRYGMSSRTLEDLIFVREGSPERSAWEVRMNRARAAATELETVARRLGGPKLSRAMVESSLGVPLVASKGDPTGATVWEASLGRGVVSKAVYRETQSASGLVPQSLVFHVRADVPIPERLVDLRALEGRLGLRVGAETDGADELRKLTFKLEPATSK
jgi:hypothetical protein